MKRWLALVAFLSLFLIALVGCAGGDDNPGFSSSDSGSGGDSSSDGGVGFGKDSGGKDATTTDDGGVSDSGTEDSSVTDSGTDGGVDAGFDAGVDAGPPFTVTVAASTSDTTATITFSDPPNATQANDKTHYAISGGLTVSAAVLSGNTVTLTTDVQSAMSYTITVSGVTRNADGATLTTNTANFTGIGAFDVSSATSKNSTTVNVLFDAPPDATSAVVLGNYAISGGLTVSAATLTGSTVTLTTSTQTATSFTVTVSNVTRASDAATLATSTANFTGHPTFNVTSAVANSATKVTVTFDAAPNTTTGSTATNFTITGLNVSAATPSGNTVVLTTDAQSASSFTVNVANVTRASDDEPLTTNTAGFTGVTPFNLLSATSTSSATVDLVFDSPPTSAEATTAGNYALSGGLTVSGATLSGSTVTLSTSVQSATSFTVTVSNVTRLSDGAGLTTNAATFTGTAPSIPTVTSVAVIDESSDSTKTPYNTGTTTVMITGTDLLTVACPTSGTTGVKLDDTDGSTPPVAVGTHASCTVDSNTQITAVFPAGIRTNGSTGWNVLVTNSVGTNTVTAKFIPRAGLLISGVMIGSSLGTSGAAGDHEFIEIYNPTGNSIDCSSAGVNLKLHSFSAAGNDGGNKPLTLVTGKSLTIISHGFLLLAPKNLTGDAWDGTVDATYSTASLSSNGGLYIGILSSANGANVIDKFGWGTQVNGFETMAYVSNLVNDFVAVRLPGAGSGHATDSDNNAADFLGLSATIAPKGTASGKEDP